MMKGNLRQTPNILLIENYHFDIYLLILNDKDK